MNVQPQYGLLSINMGDWARGRDPQTEKYIENTKSGFRVYCQYPNIRFDLGTRYIVRKGDLSMGFSLAKDLAMYHVEYPSEETPKVFVSTIGGRYATDSAWGKEGFTTLADATHFETIEQQQLFLEALVDAVPRIPAVGSHAFRWDGGFGYQVQFTQELSEKLKRKDFLRPK